MYAFREASVWTCKQLSWLCIGAGFDKMYLWTMRFTKPWPMVLFRELQILRGHFNSLRVWDCWKKVNSNTWLATVKRFYSVAILSKCRNYRTLNFLTEVNTLGTCSLARVINELHESFNVVTSCVIIIFAILFDMAFSRTRAKIRLRSEKNDTQVRSGQDNISLTNYYLWLSRGREFWSMILS